MSKIPFSFILLSLAGNLFAVPGYLHVKDASLVHGSNQSSAPDSSNNLNPAIKGIDLGSFLPKVRRKLGRPLRIIVEPYDHDMGMGAGRTFKYGGMEVGLIKPPKAKEFHVWSIVVTGSQWIVSPRFRVGMSRQEAVGLLGSDYEASTEQETGNEILHSTLPLDRLFWLTVNNGKVVEIGMMEDWT